MVILNTIQLPYHRQASSRAFRPIGRFGLAPVRANKEQVMFGIEVSVIVDDAPDAMNFSVVALLQLHQKFLQRLKTI